MPNPPQQPNLFTGYSQSVDETVGGLQETKLLREVAFARAETPAFVVHYWIPGWKRSYFPGP